MEKIIIIVVIVFILLVGGLTIGLGGFGTGDGNPGLNAITEEKLQNEEVIIKVEEKTIYFGEEECADIEDLTDRISEISSKKRI